jgi:4'-phosphopantetheinyl transferase EntD
MVSLDDEPPCPYPAERAAIASGMPRRRREFLAGRACAHAALRAIGRDGVAVGRGPMREPLWPAGAVGSISHAGDLAAAIAARAADAWGVGLDIELLDPPLDAAVERLVLRPGELARAAPADPLGPHHPKIAFAVKECVYKCLFPRTQWPLAFHDIEVEINPDRHRFRAVVDDRFRLAGLPLPPLEGRFEVVGDYVLVGLWVGPEGPR